MNSLLLPGREIQQPPPADRALQPSAVVLVGCGAVSRLFYQPALLELSRLRQAQVAALVDPVESARALIGRRFPEAQCVTALAEADAPAGSLAVVASPPRLHATQTIAALERGWHVLCEKPMATSVADGERMLAAATANGRLLAVGLYKRLFPASRWLRELTRQSTLGRLRSFEIQEGGPFTWPASPSFFRRDETPGGVLLDIGPHVLDLLLWWFGEPAAVDYADDAWGGLEANAVIRLDYIDGARGTVQLSRDWPTRQRYHFEFEGGTVDWTVNEANRVTLQLSGLSFPVAGTLVNEAAGPAATNAHCFIAQLQNMLTAMRDGVPVGVDGREGLRTVRLIAACYARRRRLEQPWLLPSAGVRLEGKAS